MSNHCPYQIIQESLSPPLKPVPYSLTVSLYNRCPHHDPSASSCHSVTLLRGTAQMFCTPQFNRGQHFHHTTRYQYWVPSHVFHTSTIPCCGDGGGWGMGALSPDIWGCILSFGLDGMFVTHSYYKCVVFDTRIHLPFCEQFRLRRVPLALCLLVLVLEQLLLPAGC